MRHTEAQLAYLKEGYPLMELEDLTRGFNEYFGTSKSVQAMKSTLQNHRITCGRPTGTRKRQSDIFTNEQIEFMRIRYQEITAPELVIELKEFYGIDRTPQQVKTFVKNHGITSGRTGQFTKGSVSWNAGTKGVMKPNSGNFKPGDVPANIKPLGHERICKKDGYILIKVAERNPHTGAPTRYRLKHHVVFEEHRGRPVKSDHVLTFRDGDKLNCDIENLEEIPHQLHVRLNQLRYWEQPDELKPAIRAQAELQSAIGSAKKRLEK